MHRWITLFFVFACFLFGGFLFGEAIELENELLNLPEEGLEARRTVAGNSESSVSPFDSEPTGIVNGCVDAISGNYFEVQEDIVVAGAEPIVIQRIYSSANWNLSSSRNSLSAGWSFNHEGALNVSDISITHFQCGGIRQRYSKIPTGHFTLDDQQTKVGLTNCGFGQISGRSNLKNSNFRRIHIDGYPRIEQVLGSGARRIYCPTSVHEEYEDAGIRHLLVGDKTPHGNTLVYHQDEEEKLVLIQAMGAVEISRVEITYPEKIKKGSIIFLQASDGRHVNYHMTRGKSHHDPVYIKRVERPEGPTQSYKYGDEGVKGPLTRRNQPDGRFQEIGYYSNENKWENEKTIHIESEKDIRLKRVWMLRAPVGTDSKPVVTHRFYYGRNKDFSGVTGVVDAAGRLTNYHYDRNSRLTVVNKIHGSTIYSSDRLFWASNKSFNRGNLISRAFTGPDGYTFFARHFQYDLRGNILEERLLGNITGRNNAPVLVDNNGIPQSNGCEFFNVGYRYSDDGFNLLLEENNGRRQISYGYYPNTDLVEHRFVHAGRICQRHFYEYDGNAVLIKEIIDDGSSIDKNDLRDVTERHITYTSTHRNKPIGLSKTIKQKYLDLKSGNEVLLKRTVNTHSVEGGLLRQDFYDSNNQYISSLQWEYDSKGNVIREINALGETATRQYDANNNVIFEQGPRKDVHKEYTYDFSDRLIREDEVHATGMRLSITHRYNVLNERISSTDIFGNETQYTYDNCSRLVRTVMPAIPVINGGVCQPAFETEYDAMSHPVSATDANGQRTTSSFTIRGKPCLIQHSDGSSEQRQYTCDGLLERIIARNGLTTLFHHDALGQVIQTEVFASTGELLSSTSATYNAFHLLTETDAAGHVTYYEYDGAGRLITIRKGNTLTTHSYDTVGHISTTRQYADAEHYTASHFSYDLLGRVIEERLENEKGQVLKQSSYGYDSEGNRNKIISYTENGPSISTISYNSRREPEVITDAEGNVTRTSCNYAFQNPFGQKVFSKEVVDPLGNATVIIHDASGRVSTTYRRNPLGTITQSQNHYYDGVGNQIAIVATVITPDASDRIVTTRWGYDSSNRLTDLWEGVGTPEQKHIQIRYNSYGQKEALIKPNGTALLYTYDDMGRLATQQSADGTCAYQFTYDNNSHLVTITGPEGTTQRVYDENDRLVSETLANGLTLDCVYDGLGRSMQVTLPDQSAIGYEYNGCYLTNVQRLVDHAVIYQHQYTSYDLSGHLTSETLIGTLGNATLNYDQLGRLKSKESLYYQENLAYDAINNLIQRTFRDALSSLAPLTCLYSYDSLSQLKTEQGAHEDHIYSNDSLYNRVSKDGEPHQINAVNQLLSDGRKVYTYDAAGNLLQTDTGEKAIHYAYDALDRLISVTNGNEQTCYSYDSDNRRLTKTSHQKNGEDWEAGPTIRYLYQGKNEIGAYEGDQLTELRILGQGQSAEIGATIALELEGTVYAPLHDHRGNIVAIVDSSGQTVGTYRYSAFGEEQVTGLLSPWRFSSKRFDTESGFVYFGCRYYMPETGRWLTQDPAGHAAGPNLYAYVHNSPMTHTDAYGLIAQANNRSSGGTFADFCGRVVDRVSGFFRETAKRVRDTVSSVARSPGRLIEHIGRNYVPVPIVRDAVEFTGRILAGRSYQDYVPSYRQQHSFYATVGDKSVGSVSVRFMTSNGIATNAKELYYRALCLSEMLGGIQVTYCYNATHGFAYDAIEWVCQRIGISTHSAQVMQDSIMDCVQSVGGLNSGGEVWGEFHSQAGEILNSIRKKIDPGVKQMMRVFTYGSPCIIPDGEFKETRVFISVNDMVPMLDPINYAKACFGCYSHVIFLSSNNLPLIDHSCEGKTYMNARKNIAKYNISFRGAS